MTNDRDRLATLEAIAQGFDRHDIDAIMRHFADDAVFESPRRPEVFGRRFEGAPTFARPSRLASPASLT